MSGGDEITVCPRASQYVLGRVRALLVVVGAVVFLDDANTFLLLASYF